MKLRVFLDANILFSAACFDGALGSMVRILIRRKEAFSNVYACEEACRNVLLKFPGRIAALEKLIVGVRVVPVEENVRASEFLPEKDRPIFSGAVAGKCTHLLTGDLRHFGSMLGKTKAGVRVVTPRLLAEELVGLGRAERTDRG